MKNRDIYWRKYKTEETLYIGQWCLSPLQSRHHGTSHNSPNHHQLSHHIFLNLMDIWNLFLYKGNFSFGKSQKSQCHSIAQIWAIGGLSHLGDVMFCKKTRWMRWDAWAGTLSWWSCQSPVAHSCGLLNHPNSFHRVMFKLNTKFDADSLLCSLSNFECNGHRVHMLIQWCLLPPLTSTVKSSLFTMLIPVHSPWLPGYINVT